MPLLSLCLVILAAFAHASWNLLAKKASASRHFIWFYSAGSTVIFLPAVLWIVVTQPMVLRLVGLILLGTSALLHLLYSHSLQRGYQVADLSVVYPLARGTGPLLSFCGAIAWFGEPLSFASALSALMVVSGIFLIAGGQSIFHTSRARQGLFWGVATGIVIASYTLTDGYAVKVIGLSPVLVDYGGNLFRCVVLVPKVWRDRQGAFKEYRHYWKPALGVSLLGPGGYILVLYAMRDAPISHVAPARELSMLVGSYFGMRLLGEGHGITRILAALLIICGVIGLSLH